jgi:hypothetical protein
LYSTYIEVIPTEEKCSVCQLHPSDWVVCAAAQASSHSSPLSDLVECMVDNVTRMRLFCILRFPMCFQKNSLFAFEQRIMLLRRNAAKNESIWKDYKERTFPCCSRMHVTLSYSIVIGRDDAFGLECGCTILYKKWRNAFQQKERNGQLCRAR